MTSPLYGEPSHDATVVDFHHPCLCTILSSSLWCTGLPLAYAHTGINGLPAGVPAARKHRTEPAFPYKGAEHPLAGAPFPYGLPQEPQLGDKGP